MEKEAIQRNLLKVSIFLTFGTKKQIKRYKM